MKKIKLSLLILFYMNASGFVLGDGKVFPPRNYKGSLEEKSQEAIIVFKSGTQEKSAVQDLILKIQVEGNVDDFAWVIPLPNPPKTAKADAKLFKEVFDYVQARKYRSRGSKKKSLEGAEATKNDQKPKGVKVISREVVGNYDVAVVREKVAGSLNVWLDKEGYQSLPKGEAVIDYYRNKGFVFTCIKVKETGLKKKQSVNLHPLRFTFETGGRDGIFFPMKMTGLQTEPFHVNLYVFYDAWLNEKINKYGYTKRGFHLYFRDWDSPKCKPNAGKSWAEPAKDPYLKPLAQKIPTLKKFFAKNYPKDRFYLTNIKAHNLKPAQVKEWEKDLWMFPHYVNRSFVPFDVRQGGPAN